ncbi:MAG: hypothetical protein ACHQ01_09635 [Candidatus Limnocylindrales bacterium]
MKPHTFHQEPTDALLRSYPAVCGHVDTEAQLLCVQPQKHPDHIVPDSFEVLERRMRGAPTYG